MSQYFRLFGCRIPGVKEDTVQRNYPYTTNHMIVMRKGRVSVECTACLSFSTESSFYKHCVCVCVCVCVCISFFLRWVFLAYLSSRMLLSSGLVVASKMNLLTMLMMCVSALTLEDAVVCRCIKWLSLEGTKMERLTVCLHPMLCVSYTRYWMMPLSQLSTLWVSSLLNTGTPGTGQDKHWFKVRAKYPWLCG